MREYLSISPYAEREFLNETRRLCVICPQLENHRDPSYKFNVAETRHLVLRANPNASVPQSYVLFSRAHALNMSRLEARVGDEFESMVGSLLSKSGTENIFLFENAAGRNQDGNHGIVAPGSIYHPHVSFLLLPSNEDILQKIRERLKARGAVIRPVSLDRLWHGDQVNKVGADTAYFYIGQGREAFIVFDPTVGQSDRRIPSQAIRHYATEAHPAHRDRSAPWWDWKDPKNLMPPYAHEWIEEMLV